MTSCWVWWELTKKKKSVRFKANFSQFSLVRWRNFRLENGKPSFQQTLWRQNTEWNFPKKRDNNGKWNELVVPHESVRSLANYFFFVVCHSLHFKNGVAWAFRSWMKWQIEKQVAIRENSVKNIMREFLTQLCLIKNEIWMRNESQLDEISM